MISKRNKRMDQKHTINNFNNPTLLRMLPQRLTPLHQPIQLSKLLFKIQPLLSKRKKKLLKLLQKKIKVKQKSQKNLQDNLKNYGKMKPT